MTPDDSTALQSLGFADGGLVMNGLSNPRGLGRLMRHAHGGMVQPSSFHAPAPVMPNPSVLHQGALRSLDGGRTDTLPISVKSGSYVVPADVVSALGQGNSDAGHRAIHSIFYGPYGIKPKSRVSPGLPSGMPEPPLASGGVASAPGGMPGPDSGQPVDIMAAGGEHVLPPEVMAAVGNGNPEHGFRATDKFVKKVRKNHIKTLSKLPAPAR